MSSRDRFEGCLLGLALGDALGAPYEGGILERLVWRLIGRTSSAEMRWTDDTQMSLDLAESLIAEVRVDPDDLARRFAAGYRWSRGFGPGSAKLLKRIAAGADWREATNSVYPDGSYGNGAAMRAPVVGISFAGRLEELRGAARDSAVVTHSHPLGVEGAVLLAAATAFAARGLSSHALLRAAAGYCSSEPYTNRLARATSWTEAEESVPASQVRHKLGNGIAAPKSCVTAIYVAARFLHAPFKEMMGYVVSLRGDVDTIGAMAGAVWGAANGASRLPSPELGRLEQRSRIQAVAKSLFERFRRGG